MTIDLDQDINGSSQGDVLNGAGGNDRMFGGAGSDTMNGGAGSDSLNGGSGHDTLIYNVSANSAAGTADVYMGGSGKDTLFLQFTRAEWLAHQVQGQLAAYLRHLAAVTNANTGEVSNGTASDFVFTFGGSTLTVQMVEHVRVSVDGVEITPGNDPVTAAADTGAVVEDGPAVNIGVLANDSVPDLVATLALASGPAHGTATLVQPDANDPSTWHFRYQANAADYQYLARGQTATDSFTYTVTDADGGTGTATVVVTITGTNDAPVVAAATVTGGATELVAPAGDLTSSGTIAFTDADLTDVHGVGAVTASAGALGTLTASVTADTTGTGTGGVVSWNYSVGAAAAEYLAAGETRTETFSFDVEDGQGGAVTRTVSVTLTGTNDAPIVAGEDVTGAVTESVAPSGNLTDTGTIAFTDADLTDVHSVGPVTASAGALGTLTATVSAETTGSGTGGVVTWNYSVAAAAAESLAAGQTKTESFTFDVSDGHGGLVTRTVDVTLTGTNDAPQLADTPDPAAVAESAGSSWMDIAPFTGSLAVTDADEGDTLTAQVVGAPVVRLDGEPFALPGSAAGLVNPGVFTLGAVASGPGGRSVGYTYDPTLAGLDFLGQDQRLTITYTVQVQDGSAASNTQDVTFTINGTNDAPGVLAAQPTWDVTEDGVVALSGGQPFTDDYPDISGHTVAPVSSYVWGTGAPTRGVLTASVAQEPAPGGGVGDVNWSYTLAPDAYELSAGERLIEVHVMHVIDQYGAWTNMVRQFVVHGVNDAPVVDAGDVTGAVVEIGAPVGNLTDSGTIAFADQDKLDVHSVGPVTASAGALGTLAASVSTDTTGSGNGGVVTWNYSVAAAAVEYLSEGQTRTESFSFDVSDGHGGSVTRTVSVTLTGTNDAPVTAPVALAAMAEDSGVRVITQAELLAQASDVDSANLVATGLTLAPGSRGILADNQDGTWSFTPALDDDTGVSFSYLVSDGSSTTAGSATLDLTPVDDVPARGQGLVGVYIDTWTSSNRLADFVESLGAAAVLAPAFTSQGLSGLAALVLDMYSITSLSGTQRTAIFDAVQQGMNLVVNDWNPLYDYSFMPKMGSLVAAGYSSGDVDVVNESSWIASGPAGQLLDGSLDGGNSSTHGTYTPASVQAMGGTAILTSAGNVTALEYDWGAGKILFAGMPVGAYLNDPWSGQNVNDGMQVWLRNEIANALREPGITSSGNGAVTGTSGDDALTGGAGSDTIFGGVGFDRMTGGTGADTFRFARPSDLTDIVTDFTPGIDRLAIEVTGFGGGLVPGGLAAGAFAQNTTGAATTATQRLIYESDTGVVWFDADGTGAKEAVQVVRLVGAPAISAADFVIV